MEPKALYGKKEEVTQDPDFYIPLGKGEIKRDGTDLTNRIIWSYVGTCS